MFWQKHLCDDFSILKFYNGHVTCLKQNVENQYYCKRTLSLGQSNRQFRIFGIVELKNEKI